jgi:hypothetical protein
MDLRNELVQVDEANIGLERSNITQQGQIVLPGRKSGSSDNDVAHLRDPDDYTEPDTQSSTHHVVNKIRQKKHDAGIKLRKTFHITKPSDEAEKLDAKSPILANTTEIEQSNSRLDNKEVPEKHTMDGLMHHPIDTVKEKVSNQGNQEVAANIAAKEISHGQEVDLVNASTAVDRARTESEKLLAISNLSELLKQRQSTYVRWSLDRHVSKVRVLPRDTVVLKPRSDFERTNAQEGTVIDWRAYGSHVSTIAITFHLPLMANPPQLLEYYAHRYGGQYIGYGSSPPTPSKETIMPNIERIIVATSPFQEFIMTTRRVYRWEKPVETSKYLVVYMLLWYFNIILPGVVSPYRFLRTLQRPYHPGFLIPLKRSDTLLYTSTLLLLRINKR